MAKPVLVVLAAGMGSRYGGLKQMDSVGGHGQSIIDYSIYDARRAGFASVIFVIKHALGLEFKLGSEILRTVIVRQLSEIATVAAIIALRAALTFLIHWEIKVEKMDEKPGEK